MGEKDSTLTKFKFYHGNQLSNEFIRIPNFLSQLIQINNLKSAYVLREFIKNPQYRCGFYDCFVINEEVAIEVKATSLVTEKHLKGLQSFSAKEKVRRQIIVSMDDRSRKIGNVEVLPVEAFLKKLWAGDIF